MNGSCTSPWFRMPLKGSSSMVQPTVVAMPGIMNDTQNMNSSACAHFTLVRASVQAIITATGSLSPCRGNRP